MGHNEIPRCKKLGMTQRVGRGLFEIQPQAAAVFESGQPAEDEEPLTKLLGTLGHRGRRGPEPGRRVFASQRFTLVGDGARVGAEVSVDEAQRPDALSGHGGIALLRRRPHQHRPGRGGADAGQHPFAGNDSGNATRAVGEEESPVGGIPQDERVRCATRVTLGWEETAVAETLYQEQATCPRCGDWGGLGGNAWLDAHCQRAYSSQEHASGLQGEATRLSPGQRGNGAGVFTRHGLRPLDDARARSACWMPGSRVGNPIALTAVMAPRETTVRGVQHVSTPEASSRSDDVRGCA